jgi:conjugal transfer mating pair stabilization protein TraN
VGSYCSSRLPIIRVCIETTESYCCFNSRLARILNEQGRAQLGRGWGGAESPDCSGFTVAQLQALDFSRMNLAEFYAEIAPTLPDAGTLRSRAQQKINGYFGP